MTLTTTDHNRAILGMQYVYPVLSRRAGGVSIGINLNPNNACNWRCIYCQVEGLNRGVAPDIDLTLLAQELAQLLTIVLHSDYLAREIPDENQRVLQDIAFSGNGEPTSSPQFSEAVDVVNRVIAQHISAEQALKRVLITNGSFMHQADTQQGVRAWAGDGHQGGEVWFKIDRAGRAAVRAVNDVPFQPEKTLAQLAASVSCAPTWIQSCFFAVDGKPPSDAECSDYVAFLQTALAQGSQPQGILLYTLARTSFQAEAPRLSALSNEWLDAWATRLRMVLALPVKVAYKP